ncbi:MAG: TonB-dependent receptor plug domain-containing protein [Novosphingobium sp.]|uniref:TonB-dependent receptor plug domain-containing protein n=1 Tax=Novosphingobium sp. TaxID=1874826 RepID=UPI0032B78FEC
MTRSTTSLAVLAALLAFPGTGIAQTQSVGTAEAPAAAQDDVLDEKGQIVVIATRLKGQVDAAQAPVATYDENEIAALGAGSITDLLAKVGAQTGSGRGRGDGQPVILVNGQRITNFREMRNFPPEAIKRMEVLPEEVALRYGYPADARVINFILKDNFRSRSLEAKLGVPTRGGFSTWALEGTLLKIQGPRRFSVTASTDDTSPLTESERGVIQTTPPLAGRPNPADYRTLIADSRNFGLNLSWSTGLGKDGKGGQLSLNGNATRADSRSGSGLDALDAPLQRVSHVTNISGGAGLNTNFGQWQFSATADVTHGDTRTRIDRFGGTGFDTAISNTERLTSQVTLIGRPLRLPAGEVSATINGGYNWANIVSRDTRSAAGAADLTRGRVLGGLNLALPLTSRRENVLGAVGDITLNLSTGFSHLSDFGGLTDWSAGITWSPTSKLGLQASYIVTEAAPTLTQLGSPRTETFNVPVYDFTSGQTVLATVIGGGNTALVKERQRDIKLSANWQLPLFSNSSLLLEYFRNRSSDVSAGFPLLTPAIEGAFPGRVTRDLGGRILSVDQRPVTLARQNSSRLRWGFNLTGTIGKPGEGGGMMGGMGGGGPRRGDGGARPGGGTRPAGGGRGSGGSGGGGGMMGAMFGGQGRWSLGLFHTVQLSSTVLIAPGVPALDLLDGDALSGGGTPRHSLEFNGGAFHKGFGLFAQGSWNAPTRVRASGAPGSSDLRFGALAKVNLSLFADLGRMPKLTKKAKFFKGSRLALQFENLFDARQKVTDASGSVPLSYQPDYLDPRGRVVGISFRKLF